MDTASLILVTLGALNWGIIGLFGTDVVANMFGGSGSVVTRICYTLIGLAGLWAVTLLFREKENVPIMDKKHDKYSTANDF